MMPALIFVGDVLTIRGIGPDGAIDFEQAPKRWRVKALEADLEIVLQPLNADGTVDEFLDACGDYRLTVDAVTGDTMH